MELASVKYTVESVESATAVTVSPKPGSAVTAGQFKILIPQIQRDVRGRVTDMNTDNLSEGASLANGVSISLKSVPGDWSVV